VIDQVRHAIRDAGNPMTRHPSVTGLPPPCAMGSSTIVPLLWPWWTTRAT